MAKEPLAQIIIDLGRAWGDVPEGSYEENGARFDVERNTIQHLAEPDNPITPEPYLAESVYVTRRGADVDDLTLNVYRVRNENGEPVTNNPEHIAVKVIKNRHPYRNRTGLKGWRDLRQIRRERQSGAYYGIKSQPELWGDLILKDIDRAVEAFTMTPDVKSEVDRRITAAANARRGQAGLAG